MRAVLCGLLLAAALPAFAFAADPVINNDRVTVWDVKLAPGESGPAMPMDKDSVVMTLEGGRIKTVMAGGTTRLSTRHFGDAQFWPKGSGARDTLVSGEAHEVVVALKDKTVPLPANKSGLPLAFPRPGSVKMLETPRVIVWRYSWARGKPTPMHFHDKEVVVAYRQGGTLRSTTPEGVVTDNSYKAGEIRFNKADRSHTEQLIKGSQSAVILELK